MSILEKTSQHSWAFALIRLNLKIGEAMHEANAQDARKQPRKSLLIPAFQQPTNLRGQNDVSSIARQLNSTFSSTTLEKSSTLWTLFSRLICPRTLLRLL